MPEETVYVAILPVQAIGDTTAVIHGGGGPSAWWNDRADELQREVAPSSMLVDKRFIEDLGNPDQVVVVFTTVKGWYKLQKESGVPTTDKFGRIV